MGSIFVLIGGIPGLVLYMPINNVARKSRNLNASPLRGNRTVYARHSLSFAKFSWLGKGSSVGGVAGHRGTLQSSYVRDPYARGSFDNVSRTVKSPSSGSDFPVTLKDTAYNELYSWCDEWDIDIRTQSCGFRSDPTNWDVIKRICNSTLQNSSSDGEAVYSPDEIGDVLVTGEFSSPNSPMIIYGVAGKFIDLYLQTNFEDMASVPVVTSRRGCDCEIVISYGDEDTAYGVGFGEDIDDLDFGSLDITAFIADVSAVDIICMVVDSDGNVWRSINNGNDFSQVSSINNATVVEAYLFGEIYVGTSAGEIYKSADGGATFAEITSYGSMTGSVVAIEKASDGTVYFIDSNANVAATDESIIHRISDVSTLVPTPTDILWSDDILYVSGYINDGPIIIATIDDGINWATMFHILGTADLGASFDLTPVVKMSSCGCGVIYASAVYVADGIICSAVYRSVDFGLPGLWVVEWTDSVTVAGSNIIFVPFDITCCGPNYAVVSGVYWDRSYDLGIYYISEEYKPAVLVFS